MDNLRLRQLVEEFVKLAVDAVPVEEGKEEFSHAELYKVWSDDPECMLSPMFLGYVLGEGEDINAFTPEDMHLAILAGSECENSNVEFDWLGDLDATSKPH